MKRETSVVTTMLFLAMSPLMLGQDKASQPSPVLPYEILGPRLIAWSQLQKPQPVPQPLPPPDRPAQQTSQPSQSANAPQEQKPAAPTQTLTGTIIKDGSTYVLKVSGGSVYPLDDPDRAKQYESKQVKIAGTLEPNGRLHVISIELIS